MRGVRVPDTVAAFLLGLITALLIGGRVWLA